MSSTIRHWSINGTMASRFGVFILVELIEQVLRLLQVGLNALGDRRLLRGWGQLFQFRL